VTSVEQRAHAGAILTFVALLFSGTAMASAPADGQTDSKDSGAAEDDTRSSRDSRTSQWQYNLDGAFYGIFNRQSGPRGDIQMRSQNWLMAMGSRPLGSGTLTVSGMLTAEPLTAEGIGYSEIFQEGEAYHGLQITDHQHPHNLFMQLAAAWRLPLGRRVQVTIAGGPVGEPTLGPVAFMHRASAAEDPIAPLAHHIFDSTHVANGVVLARVDRGLVSVEGSVFRGREPDEHRYDIETGALDSWAMRVWLRPSAAWTIQASHGYLHQPEQLEPGDQRRTNASASWYRQSGSDYTAFTVAAGQNRRQYSVVGSILAEGTHHFKRTSLYGRFENTSVETEILLFPEIVHRPHPGELVDTIRAATAGIVRDIGRFRELAVGVGADATVYGVPPVLDLIYGAHPLSCHVFLRVGLANPANRMWNATMGAHEAMVHEHAHH